jgi:hypothetical protein
MHPGKENLLAGTDNRALTRQDRYEFSTIHVLS